MYKQEVPIYPSLNSPNLYVVVWHGLKTQSFYITHIPETDHCIGVWKLKSLKK